MRRVVCVFVLAVVSLAWLPASADTTFAARGTVSFTLKIPGAPVATCPALTLVQFRLTGPTFALHEFTPAGQKPNATPPVCAPLAFAPYTNAYPGVHQCTGTPIGGLHVVASTLTVSGSTYTIRSPYTTCAGGQYTDTIVMTVSGTTVVYKHDLTDPDGTEIHVSGTLTRDA